MTESQKTVLFVEDEPDLRSEMKEALEEAGFIMLEAADGERALAIAREKKPDLVLLDLILPGGGGFRLLETFSNDDELKDISVVVLTNLDDSEHIERALALGARSYLVKTHYALSDIVKHVIEKIQSTLSTSDKNE